ncbi:hypothetical protein OJAV_G00157420 [Oryzias javanicus]|uniref:Uncharacterized protein n=1 Tax=Oryzias javanicus TaxID=123683 RepID=A0A3S2PVX1_ORYJA|nr:hypothetical protein OJAV_G00157420 [Oryzias javanicus]
MLESKNNQMTGHGWTASDRIFCSHKDQKYSNFYKRLKICSRLFTCLHHLLEFLKPTTRGRFSSCLGQKFLDLQTAWTVDFLFNPHGFHSLHNQEPAQRSSMMSHGHCLRAAPLHVNTRSRRPTLFFFYQQIRKTPPGSEEAELLFCL